MRAIGFCGVVLALSTGASAVTLDVIQEDFQDDNAGDWRDNTGFTPQNAGRPGTWMASGHVPGGTPDTDWTPLVQNAVGAGMTVPTGEYFASKNRVGNQTGVVGVYNMDGIIQFSLANGTPRPATTGEKIVGQITWAGNDGNLGFGFTDNIAALQSYQAAIPVWNGVSPSPVNMPTGYTDIQNGSQVGFSANVTGHIAINSGANGLHTHAAVDIAENGGLGDGLVDQGVNTPKVHPSNNANRPLPIAAGATQTIRFEYTLGNATYDVLQVDQDGPNGAGGFVDIRQSSVVDTTPTPNGPMPVGKVMSTIEGMFITGGNGQLTEIWYDDIAVQIVTAGTPGDFNADSVVDALDIDLLTAHIRASGTDPLYDVNSDSAVNSLDLTYEVETILGTEFGDTNLDLDVDLSDLGTLATNYEGAGPYGWAMGNFDTDTDVDLVDLGSLATNYQGGSAQAFADALALGVTVPEPAGLALLGLAGLAIRRRR